MSEENSGEDASEGKGVVKSLFSSVKNRISPDDPSDKDFSLDEGRRNLLKATGAAATTGVLAACTGRNPGQGEQEEDTQGANRTTTPPTTTLNTTDPGTTTPTQTTTADPDPDGDGWVSNDPNDQRSDPEIVQDIYEDLGEDKGQEFIGVLVDDQKQYEEWTDPFLSDLSNYSFEQQVSIAEQLPEMEEIDDFDLTLVRAGHQSADPVEQAIVDGGLKDEDNTGIPDGLESLHQHPDEDRTIEINKTQEYRTIVSNLAEDGINETELEVLDWYVRYQADIFNKYDTSKGKTRYEQAQELGLIDQLKNGEIDQNVVKALRDKDNDGLINAYEQQIGTNPEDEYSTEITKDPIPDYMKAFDLGIAENATVHKYTKNHGYQEIQPDEHDDHEILSPDKDTFMVNMYCTEGVDQDEIKEETVEMIRNELGDFMTNFMNYDELVVNIHQETVPQDYTAGSGGLEDGWPETFNKNLRGEIPGMFAGNLGRRGAKARPKNATMYFEENVVESSEYARVVVDEIAGIFTGEDDDREELEHYRDPEIREEVRNEYSEFETSSSGYLESMADVARDAAGSLGLGSSGLTG